MPLAELLRIVRNLATFPPALAMLNVAINNHDPPDKIAAIIGSDSDLTSRLRVWPIAPTMAFRVKSIPRHRRQSH